MNAKRMQVLTTGIVVEELVRPEILEELQSKFKGKIVFHQSLPL